MFKVFVSLAICGLLASAQEPKKPQTSVEIVAHVVKPAKLPAADALSHVKVPPGFSVSVFADQLDKPRTIAVAPDGAVYVTSREAGTVTLLKDTNHDGKADSQTVVFRRPQTHGIAIVGDRAYIVTVKELYVAARRPDGTLEEPSRIVDDLPEGGQHADRMVVPGPDGMLYLSVGSTCNACDETSPENATMLRVKPDGSSRTIFASGLRNTIGYGFHPETHALWGMDNGIDWLGDQDQPEELNLIEQAKQYGWPYVYGASKFNPQDEPPGELSMAEWARLSRPPTLTYTPHSAPMQMAFYTATMFPAAYKNDAFVAMRGSWNRLPPSGYEVIRVHFEGGTASRIEPFATGFLEDQGNGQYGYRARLMGLAVAADGALLVGDDDNGVIYRIAYAGNSNAR